MAASPIMNKNKAIPPPRIIIDSTFDRIDSPQFLNFDGEIPEAKDSYFEHKTADGPAEQENSFQQLPADLRDDLIWDQKAPEIGAPCPSGDKNNSENSSSLTSSGNDLILRDQNAPEIEAPSSSQDQNNNENSSSLMSFEDDSIRDLNAPKIHVQSLSEDKNDANSPSLTSFGDDLISAVTSLQVDQPSEKQKNLVTSTPFQVKGVKPLPWRSPRKIDIKQCTKTGPLGFEERNKQLLQRRVQRVQTILQAERDARKFRANPVPKFLKKPFVNNIVYGTSLDSQKKMSKSTETQLQNSAPPRFRAKSPTVLRKPAFRPILPKQPLQLPQRFILHSELRAKERAIFDNYVKEKERLDAKLKELKEAAQKRREEEEMIKLRKQLVIKAQPIRTYKCGAIPITKRPLAEPSTPKVVKRQRR